MNERTTTSGPSVGLLLLIPAAALVARAAIRHHRMLWEEVGGPETTGPYGRHGRPFAGPGRGAGARDGFRLPPRVESMLEAWHTQAHQPAAAPEAPAAPEA